MSHLPRGMCQLKKLPANEITNIHSMQTGVLQESDLVLVMLKVYNFQPMVNNGQNRRKAMQHKTETEEQLPKRNFKDAS